MPVLTYRAEIDVDDESPASCDCGWHGPAARLLPIDDCALTPGDPSPAGRCPDCDSLAYLVRYDDAAGALRDLLEQLRGIGIYVPGLSEGQWADAEGLSFTRAEFALSAYGAATPDPEAAQAQDTTQALLRNAVIDELSRIGFQVHLGTADHDWLDGRWWWTLCRPSWSGIDTQHDNSATEQEAWMSALKYALEECARFLDGESIQDEHPDQQLSSALHC
jgi:hypothetical protein